MIFGAFVLTSGSSKNQGCLRIAAWKCAEVCQLETTEFSARTGADVRAPQPAHARYHPRNGAVDVRSECMANTDPGNELRRYGHQRC
jgi:hypothetical protein